MLPQFARRRSSTCSSTMTTAASTTTCTSRRTTTPETISKLNNDLAAVKECLAEVRMGRMRQTDAYGMELHGYQIKLTAVQQRFAHRLSKGQVLIFYQAFLKQTYGKNGSRNMPSPSTLRKQAMLLFVSHQIELHERAMRQLRTQTQRLVNYMQCELTVLQSEQVDLHTDYRTQKRIHQTDWDRIETPLQQQTYVQQMVLSHIQSLLQMRKEIRRHSLHYYEKGIVGDDDHDHDQSLNLHQHHNYYPSSKQHESSFERHDLNQSLSLVSATFEESFSILEQAESSSSPLGPKKETSMASLMKQLLELDGTFPTGPEQDEMLEQSLTNMLSIDHLWDSSSSSRDNTSLLRTTNNNTNSKHALSA
mmetsp:Transcript_18885/g.31224  ORF Transcript_18885/g.31224 Transcript_18885/m.31224 type:complete len:363 (-) Transcript_18885:93-1181(-)